MILLIKTMINKIAVKIKIAAKVIIIVKVKIIKSKILNNKTV